MQYDIKEQVATQFCITKCPCSQYCTQYGCNMKWTQDHSKVNSISHLHMETILPLFICYHIALIPLLKIVKRTSALRMARMQRQQFIRELRRDSAPGHNTTTQIPLDSVGMQPHREQPQAINLMDLL